MLRGVEVVGGVVKRFLDGVGRLKVRVGLYPLHLQKMTVIAINLACCLLHLRSAGSVGCAWILSRIQ